MKIDELKNKKIAIFGFGTEGKSLVKFLLKKKISRLTIYDEKKFSPDDINYLKSNSLEYFSGDFDNQNFKEIEIAFRSPGLRRDSIANLLPKNAKLTTLTNLFFANHKGKIIAVTGTKGKSTTVGLLANVLKQNDLKYFVGGNIGNPPIEFLDETTPGSFSVLELSSFQLEDLEFSPDVAVILPISLDHMGFHANQGKHFNYHQNLKEYLESKAKIVTKMDSNDLIIAHKAENIEKIIVHSNARKVTFSAQPTKNGCGLNGNNVECISDSRKEIFKGIQQASRDKKIPLINLVAAASFAFSMKLKFDAANLSKGFKKLPFRIELVATKDGIKYFNDSAATNPVSTIEAMKTMGESYALIMGGSSKGLSFDELAKVASSDSNLYEIYLFGQTASQISNELEKSGFSKPVHKKETLDEVMSSIKDGSKEFSAVLFSPASASFDQYKNYRERGLSFNKLADL